MAYLDQTYFENYIGRDLTAKEAAIFASILAATELYINNLLGTTYGTPGSATTKYYDTQDARHTYRTLLIDPVKDITKVAYVDAENDETGELIESNYIARPLNSDVKTYLERRGGNWAGGRRKIAVTGKFGSGAVTDNVKLAAAILMQDFFESQQTGELESETIEGYTRKFFSGSSTNSGSLSSRQQQVNQLLGIDQDILI